MKPHPSHVMPFGLAMTSRAACPAISMLPSSRLGWLPLTSFRMTRAADPFSAAFAGSGPASTLLASPAELLNTRPWRDTSKVVQRLCEMPAASGAVMPTTGTSPTRVTTAC